MKSPLALVISLLAVACTTTLTGTGSGNGADAGGSDDVNDPPCPARASSEEVPSGSCTTGATCAFTGRTATCEPGVQFVPACANVYRCTCGPDGWGCEIIGGCLGVTPCSSTADAGTNDDADVSDDGGTGGGARD